MNTSYRARLITGILAAFFLAGMLYAFFLPRPAALIPRELLFGIPERYDPKISPDGSLVAYLAPYGKRPNVWLYDRAKKTERPLTLEKEAGISSYTWTPDGTAILFRQESGARNGHLQKIGREGGAVQDLTPFAGVQARVLSTADPEARSILLELNKEEPHRPDAYRLDLRTGVLELVARKTGMILDWVIDGQMRVRGAVAARRNGGLGVIVRDSESSQWRKLFAWDMEDSEAGDVTGFSKNGKELFLIDPRGSNTARLVRMDLVTGERKTVFSDPDYDVGEVSVSPESHEPDMVSVVRERQSWIALRDSVRADLERVRKIHSGDFSIVSRTRDDRIWIVVFDEDVSPLNYYLYDRNTKRSEFLFAHRPALFRYPLAPMKPVAFSARDGLKLRGYLTLPVGGRKPFPMVLLVHGGPWSRDRWRFDPLAQWLANRGYACLQVNFRGSTGYGKNFLNAGNKEWGRKMQNDLTDGVVWAVREGIADPVRVGIMGASYGGYAALAGAAFTSDYPLNKGQLEISAVPRTSKKIDRSVGTPELYKCAVDQFGPSDLVALIRTMPPFWADQKGAALKRVGDPDTEADDLKERSPLYAADKVRIPLLIAQGANDAQTPRAESDRMVEALRKRKIECEYWVFPDEGHGFLKQENRLKFYHAVEAFLARHLGGRSES